MNAALPIAREGWRQGSYARGIIAEHPACRWCPLHGQVVVPPEGNPAARIALVGEGPGEHEVRLRRPFVGDAGDLLNQLLANAGLRRADVWVSNATMCRPRSYTARKLFRWAEGKGKLRVVHEEEREILVTADEAKVAALPFCRVRLLTELCEISPTVVAPLGRLSYEAVFGVRRSIQVFRGSVEKVDLEAQLAAARERLTEVEAYYEAAEAAA